MVSTLNLPLGKLERVDAMGDDVCPSLMTVTWLWTFDQFGLLLARLLYCCLQLAILLPWHRNPSQMPVSVSVYLTLSVSICLHLYLMLSVSIGGTTLWSSSEWTLCNYRASARVHVFRGLAEPLEYFHVRRLKSKQTRNCKQNWVSDMTCLFIATIHLGCNCLLCLWSTSVPLAWIRAESHFKWLIYTYA